MKAVLPEEGGRATGSGGGRGGGAGFAADPGVVPSPFCDSVFPSVKGEN